MVLKRQYLDEVRRESSGSGAPQPLSGQDWYRLEASRAVNQAVGRVIRHRRDYGAVILCDSRFGDAGFSGQLSAWVRPFLRVHPNFGTVVRELTQFFKACQEKVGGIRTDKGGLLLVLLFSSFEACTVCSRMRFFRWSDADLLLASELFYWEPTLEYVCQNYMEKAVSVQFKQRCVDRGFVFGVSSLSSIINVCYTC